MKKDKILKSLTALGATTLTVSPVVELSSCNNSENAIKNIVINTSHVCRKYVEGDLLNLDNLKVFAVYNSGETKEVKNYKTFPAVGTELTLNDNKVVISYKGKETNFDIKVEPQKALTRIKVNTFKAKTEFFVGQTFSSEGLKVTAYYNDGSSIDNISGWEITNIDDKKHVFQDSEVGSMNVIVKYQDKTDSYPIDVVRPSLDSISVNTSEATIKFYVDDKFDSTGLKVYGKYNDGNTKEIKSGWEITNIDSEYTFKSTDVGTKKIEVRYGDKTTNYTISIAVITDMTIKVSCYDKLLDLEGLKIGVNELIDISAYDSQGQKITDGVTFKSTKEEIATIYNNSSICGKSAGETQIIAECHGYNTPIATITIIEPYLSFKQNDDGSATLNGLIKGDNCENNILIPSKVKFDDAYCPVENIGNEAFTARMQPQSVYIPMGLKQIGDKAFENCTNLKSVSMPSSVSNIGNFAFANCESLTDIDISKNDDLQFPALLQNKSIFEDCHSLTKLVFPKNIKLIPGGTCAGCNNLTEVYIPASVTKITSAFVGCVALSDTSRTSGGDTCGIWFEGTVDQWKKVWRNGNWHYNCPEEHVYCCASKQRVEMDAKEDI